MDQRCYLLLKEVLLQNHQDLEVIYFQVKEYHFQTQFHKSFLGFEYNLYNFILYSLNPADNSI